jgi:hypothetical protein
MFRRTRLTKSERRPHRVAMLACDNTQILDITGPLEVSTHTAKPDASTRCSSRPQVF